MKVLLKPEKVTLVLVTLVKKTKVQTLQKYQAVLTLSEPYF